jgi:16S rRNA C1402 N4-methylase RsmH
MSLEQAILEAARALPSEKQQEILSHATRLREETAKKKPFKSVKGLWADLGVSLSADEIDENRRRMSKGFPRQVESQHVDRAN